MGRDSAETGVHPRRGRCPYWRAGTPLPPRPWRKWPCT